MEALVTTPPCFVHYSLTSSSKMLFGLGHLINDRTWIGEWYTSTLAHASLNLGMHLILDNGVTETGKPLALNELLYRGTIVGADEIVLPDEYQDEERTREYVDDAVRAMHRAANLPDAMVVLHQQNGDRLAQDLMEWSEHRCITTLGVPKHQTSSTYWTEGRLSILRVIENLEMHKRFKVHLLGVWEDLREVRTIAKKFPWVRSIDTSWPVMAGYKGINVFAEPKKKVHYEPDPQEAFDGLLMISNLATFQRWALGL